jgi:hypothetical protein
MLAGAQLSYGGSQFLTLRRGRRRRGWSLRQIAIAVELLPATAPAAGRAQVKGESRLRRLERVLQVADVALLALAVEVMPSA